MPLLEPTSPRPVTTTTTTPTVSTVAVTSTYITHVNPTPRSEDTVIGKITGYLAEILEWLKWENACFQIDTVFPDYFPFDIVQNLLISVCKGLYARIYQTAYNRGADRGNEINNQIVGWMNTLQSQVTTYVNDTKAWIQSNLIDPIKNEIDTNINPKLKDAISRISTLTTDLNNALSQVNTMGQRITSFDTSIKDFQTKIGNFDTTLGSLKTTASNLDSNLKDAQSKLATYKGLIDDLDKRVKSLEGTKAFTLPNLPDIFKTS